MLASDVHLTHHSQFHTAHTHHTQVMHILTCCSVLRNKSLRRDEALGSACHCSALAWFDLTDQCTRAHTCVCRVTRVVCARTRVCWSTFRTRALWCMVRAPSSLSNARAPSSLSNAHTYTYHTPGDYLRQLEQLEFQRSVEHYAMLTSTCWVTIHCSCERCSHTLFRTSTRTRAHVP